EGVVLEYSKDGGVTWFPLGGTNSGINWFNTSGFGIGNIGSSPIGWSGGSWTLEDNTEADTLTEARRALDNLNNLNQGERANVRFRFAFATDGFDEYEGFAFNNFSISSRDRISLVENFTNNSSTRYGYNNTVFTNTIPNTEVAKIQYHVGFPDTDSEYEVNTVDPLARAAYYGIPMTDQQIPRSYIDGISDGPLDPNNNGIPNLANWAATRFSKQSLKTSDFDVSVESLDASDNSYFKIRAVVTAKTDIGAAKRPVLHLAVVEKTVDNNRFVLRKLVPNAVGHALPTGMNEDDFIEVIDSVRIEKPQIDVTELALVAFIQDVNTREVFQADLDLNPQFLPDQPTLVTAIEDLAEHITIYPNPANESFEIELPFKAENRFVVNLIDPVGRTAQQLYFEKGEQTKTVNTQNLAQGIYVVQIGSGKTGVVRKKVMVVH
ncbi:MAG TPA: T9SS type A sorting domain-containing protein, partial [Cyclobacteriaceae bacterium]|nr:T9SS type A sorting domain-containing protein [Cyclobacteriaceae bacterium]